MDAENSNLIQQLRDPSKEQRISAADALGEFDRIHSDSVLPLVEALQDVDRDVRLSSLSSLRKIWRAVAGPMGEVTVREDQSDQLFGALNRALKGLLGDEDKYVRFGAAEGLRDLYCNDDSVFHVFAEAARDADESLRRRAALALWLGATDKRAPLSQVGTEPAVAVLIELLRDQSKDVRNYALRAVSSVGPLARSATPVLLEILQVDDDDVRFNAAFALASFGTGAQAALPILVETLTNGDRLKRKAAAFALRTMGPEAKPAMPVLIKGLKDHEKRVRSRCVDTLGLIGPGVDDVAIQALLEVEKDEDQEVRSAAQRALEAIGKDQVAAAQGS
jgi:HEAT repeat protein